MVNDVMRGGKTPNAAQRRFHNWIKEQLCPITGQSASLHHCAGSTARHNKIHIGQWWCIPLSYEAHQGVRGIHGDCSIFPAVLGSSRKEIEKSLFEKIAINYVAAGGEALPQEIISSIMGYHR